MSGDYRSNAPDTLVTSSANPSIKLARSLHRRKSRERERALLLEGARSLVAAIGAGAFVRTVLIDDSRRGEVDQDLFEHLDPATRVIYVDHAIFESVTLTEHPQPVAAIVGMPDLHVSNDSTLVLVVDGVRDPGNLGTMIRSAAAVGADAVALLPETADPTNPKAVRASAGAIYTIPVRRFSSVGHVAETLFAQPPIIALADANADRGYDEVDWREPTAIVIGGEAFGASEKSRTFADIAISIPIQAGVESLNAGVAASILLFEVARRRRADR